MKQNKLLLFLLIFSMVLPMGARADQGRPQTDPPKEWIRIIDNFDKTYDLGTQMDIEFTLDMRNYDYSDRLVDGADVSAMFEGLDEFGENVQLHVKKVYPDGTFPDWHQGNVLNKYITLHLTGVANHSYAKKAFPGQATNAFFSSKTDPTGEYYTVSHTSGISVTQNDVKKPVKVYVVNRSPISLQVGKEQTRDVTLAFENMKNPNIDALFFTKNDWHPTDDEKVEIEGMSFRLKEVHPEGYVPLDWSGNIPARFVTFELHGTPTTQLNDRLYVMFNPNALHEGDNTQIVDFNADGQADFEWETTPLYKSALNPLRIEITEPKKRANITLLAPNPLEYVIGKDITQEFTIVTEYIDIDENQLENNSQIYITPTTDPNEMELETVGPNMHLRLKEVHPDGYVHPDWTGQTDDVRFITFTYGGITPANYADLSGTFTYAYTSPWVFRQKPNSILDLDNDGNPDYADGMLPPYYKTNGKGTMLFSTRLRGNAYIVGKPVFTLTKGESVNEDILVAFKNMKASELSKRYLIAGAESRWDTPYLFATDVPNDRFRTNGIGIDFKEAHPDGFRPDGFVGDITGLHFVTFTLKGKVPNDLKEGEFNLYLDPLGFSFDWSKVRPDLNADGLDDWMDELSFAPVKVNGSGLIKVKENPAPPVIPPVKPPVNPVPQPQPQPKPTPPPVTPDVTNEPDEPVVYEEPKEPKKEVPKQEVPKVEIPKKEYSLLRGKIVENIKDNIVDKLSQKYKDMYERDKDKYSEYTYLIGYPDGTFKLENVISKQELAEVLSRILTGFKRGDLTHLNKFSDKIPTWSSASVASLVELGLYGFVGEEFNAHDLVDWEYFNKLSDEILKILK